MTHGAGLVPNETPFPCQTLGAWLVRMHPPGIAHGRRRGTSCLAPDGLVLDATGGVYSPNPLAVHRDGPEWTECCPQRRGVLPCRAGPPAPTHKLPPDPPQTYANGEQHFCQWTRTPPSSNGWRLRESRPAPFCTPPVQRTSDDPPPPRTCGHSKCSERNREFKDVRKYSETPLTAPPPPPRTTKTFHSKIFDSKTFLIGKVRTQRGSE